MAYTNMVCIVMAYIAMAYIGMARVEAVGLVATGPSIPVCQTCQSAMAAALTEAGTIWAPKALKHAWVAKLDELNRLGLADSAAHTANGVLYQMAVDRSAAIAIDTLENRPSTGSFFPFFFISISERAGGKTAERIGTASEGARLP